jgi:ammonia channel protein AmtB
MQTPESARVLLRLAVIVLCAAAGAGVWEVLASQAPGSPLSIGMLPGPIEMLRDTALTLGLLLLGASWLVRESGATRGVVIGLHVAVAVTLLAAVYGAVSGMHGVQARDLRPDATPLFIVKYVGRLGVLASLLAIARRALAR